MSLRPQIPVSKAITAANVTALNTAVDTAITTAMALTAYVPGTIEVSNTVVVDSSNQAVYSSIAYKIFGAE